MESDGSFAAVEGRRWRLAAFSDLSVKATEAQIVS